MTAEELDAEWARCVESMGTYHRLAAMAFDDFLRRVPEEVRAEFIRRMDQTGRRGAMDLIELARETHAGILAVALGDQPG